MTGSPPSPLGLQSIIIWAKKYCFYLGFQALRGKKLLKVHILVLKKKKKKGKFYVGFPTFAAASVGASRCWDWLAHRGA